MRKVKLMFATLAITVVMATPLFAAVAGSCSKKVLLETPDAFYSCDLTGIWFDGSGNIVGCEYTCSS